MTGDGGLHLFIELEEKIHARTLLQKCYEQGVTFSPGDVFYSDGEGSDHFSIRIFTPERRRNSSWNQNNR